MRSRCIDGTDMTDMTYLGIEAVTKSEKLLGIRKSLLGSEVVLLS